ncbi:pilA-like protein (plasmid) [Kosakonia sp. SMBL-WEM22]|uniref:KAP family P-loop NTPase fold protein n=1 Tax=Kosakonia sp. SMBL-WEM22 TaxID=2725560 RepID=UPI001659F03F|nr:P-loop NTPase fold protein [Kosakonia sp. SMBL-WEM22]QNQ22907.1 pilA-like protein [Kosakonia sp. SMBL-WEM22]
MRAGERRAGQDAPISADDDDRYGFTAVADGLAESIHALEDDAGTVIGIEGRWGAGKTSLLNLLLARLRAASPPGTHVIHFSPWLSGPGGNLAEALLLPVAGILQQVESQREEADRRLRKRIARWWKKQGKSRNAGAALKVLKYVQQTSGHLAPLADLAGNVVPGFGLAAKGMDALAKLDLSARGKTAAELRGEIESRLDALGLTFVVVIDDLDRLEPSQAVEVLRLVRSVADFTRFRYVMCYDRDVLAHAVHQGLGVQDGQLYLQKIVPISFSLPRPESFTLRRHFRDEATQLYREVHGDAPDAETLSALERATDVYGEALATPREVGQALSAIRFRYAGMKDYVWFPDLCLLQLIRVTNPALHDWAERYLSERAIEMSGDATLADEEKQEITVALDHALAQFPTHAARSGWELGRWVPGVQGRREKGVAAFQDEDKHSAHAATARRRLASPVYWRYYFAFSAPGNVLSEGYVQNILRLASEDKEALAKQLLESVTDNGVSSRTWFEHILTRLTPAVTLAAGAQARAGLLAFLFVHADEVMLYYYRQRGLMYRYQSIGIEELATQLIAQALDTSRPEALAMLQELLEESAGSTWAAIYFRDVMRLHRAAGNRPGMESEKFLSAVELERLRQGMAEKMSPPALDHDVDKLDETGSYLWAWRDIAGMETVDRWVEEECSEDAAFLLFLLCMRSPVTSSDRGRYFRLDITTAEKLTDQPGLYRARLDEIVAKNDPALSGLQNDVLEAISNGRDY